MDFDVAIVNESFARRYFGDRNPIGARIGIGEPARTRRRDNEIVGVVRTFSYRGLREVDDQAFFPYFSGPVGGGGFYVRTRRRPRPPLPPSAPRCAQVDPRLTVADLRTVDDQLDRSLANERLLATLASAFAEPGRAARGGRRSTA